MARTHNTRGALTGVLAAGLAIFGLAAALMASLAAASAPTAGRLIVSDPAANVGKAGNVSIVTIQAPDTYRTTVYVPAGYRATGGLGAIGNNVGKATVFLKQSDGSRITLNGQLSVIPLTSQPDTGCAAAGETHAAIWVLKANQATGNATVTFPIYVDKQTTSSSMPASAAYTLRWCAGHTGLSVSEVDLSLVRMFINPQARGTYIWRAVYDPSAADGQSFDTSSSVGVAAAVPLKTQVTMKVSKVVNHPQWVSLSGSVTAVDKPLGGVKVQLFAGHSTRLALNRPRVTVRTKADGSYRATLHLGTGVWYGRARASAPYRDITPGGGCKSFAGNLAAKGCVDATLSPFIVVSNPLKRIL